MFYTDVSVVALLYFEKTTQFWCRPKNPKQRRNKMSINKYQTLFEYIYNTQKVRLFEYM